MRILVARNNYLEHPTLVSLLGPLLVAIVVYTMGPLLCNKSKCTQMRRVLIITSTLLSLLIVIEDGLLLLMLFTQALSSLLELPYFKRGKGPFLDVRKSLRTLYLLSVVILLFFLYTSFLLWIYGCPH